MNHAWNVGELNGPGHYLERVVRAEEWPGLASKSFHRLLTLTEGSWHPIFNEFSSTLERDSKALFRTSLFPFVLQLIIR